MEKSVSNCDHTKYCNYLVLRKKSSTLTDIGSVVMRTLEKFDIRVIEGSERVVYSTSRLTFWSKIIRDV